MIAAITGEKPDLCFFLGDGERDLQLVQERFPELAIHAVRGNCDLRSALPSFLVCMVGGKRFFLTHGHLYHVKHDPELSDLSRAAKENTADIVLFGHTHIPYIQSLDGICIMNPGSIGSFSEASYGVIEISSEEFQYKIEKATGKGTDRP